MNLRCRTNRLAASSGFLGIGAMPERDAPNLTLGKVYEVIAVPIVKNPHQGTHIAKQDIKFLVFNDAGEWDIYEPYMFEPAGQQGY